MQENYDVIIIGGSFVGLTLFNAMLSSNLKIALVESKNIGEIYEFPISISLKNKFFLDQIGCWSSINSNPITDIHVSNQGTWGITKISSDSLNMDSLGYVVSSSDLLNSLKQENESPDKVILDNTVCNNITYDNDIIRCDLKNNTSKTMITTKMLIGADGTNSFVGKSLGMPFIKENSNLYALVARVNLLQKYNNRAYQRFLKEGPSALLPFGKNRMGFVCCINKNVAQSFEEKSCDEYFKWVQSSFGYRAGKINSVEDVKVIPLTSGYSINNNKYPVVLMGNSNSTLLPIAGQGLNLAFRDVEALSNLIINSNEFEVKKIISKYNEQRIKQQKFIKKITKLIYGMSFSNKSSIKLLQKISMTILDNVPLLQKKFAYKLMGYNSDRDSIDILVDFLDVINLENDNV